MVRKDILFFSFALLGIACSKSKIRTYDGQLCSTSSADDPLYVCAPSDDLVCAHTYGIIVTDEREARKWDGGVRPVWVCRMACDPSESCRIAGDICCPAVIHGESYGKSHVCVPTNHCDRPPTPDGGARADAERQPSDSAEDTGGGGDTTAADLPVFDGIGADAFGTTTD